MNDTSLTLLVLDALARILKAGQARAEVGGGHNTYCVLMEETGAVAKIEELQEDSNEDVYRRAVGILSSYFAVEEDYDMEAQPFRGFLAAAERAGCPLPARGAFDFSR